MNLRFRSSLFAVVAAALVAGACSSGAASPVATAKAPSPAPSGRASVPATAPASAAPATSAAAPPSAAPPLPSPAGSAGTGSQPCPKAAPPPLAAGQTRTVTIQTPNGRIVIKVEANLGPKAAGNFVALVQCGYYTNVVFHRLVPGFVIQGGDGEFGRLPDVSSSVGSGGPGYEFADDPVTVPYTRGTVAMANSGPDTNGSQFFIVLADSGLTPSYSVFGHVTSGLDVVDAIAAMPNSGGRANAAINPVPMTAVTVATP